MFVMIASAKVDNAAHKWCLNSFFVQYSMCKKCVYITCMCIINSMSQKYNPECFANITFDGTKLKS